MYKKLRRSHGGFTIVELMIIVAILTLLVAIAVPNFIRARKRAQATRTLNDLRMVDAAIDRYAIDTNKSRLAPVTFSDIRQYIKPGTLLYETGPADVLGNDIVITTVDAIPKVAPTTYATLSDVAPFEFWSPYN